jgi:hypothetical protein
VSGRPCSACADARRPELDAAIAAGESFRAIARQYAPLSRDAIRRHRPHVGTALVLAAERREENLGDSLLVEMRTLQTRTLNLLDDAEKAEDGRLRAVAISQVRENVSFLSKLLAELNPAEGQDARSLAEQLKRAKAEQVSINVVPLYQMMDGQNSPHEALEKLVKDGYLTQDVADEAMRRKRDEAEPRRKALKEAALDVSS